MLYVDKIREAVGLYGDRIGIICQGKAFTYRQTNDRANSLINALIGLGAEKGDRVAVLSRNSNVFREIFWAAAKGGLAMVPISHRMAPREILYIINNTGAKIIVISSEYAPLLEEIKEGISGIEHYIGIDQDMAQYLLYEDLLDEAPSVEPDMELFDDDMLWFQYTSGTTGLPKGAVHTQKTASAFVKLSINALQDRLDMQNLRALHALPLYSMAGMAFDMIYQCVGATSVIMQKWDPTNMMRAIEKHKITDVHLVPVMINFTINAPDFNNYDLSSLRCITYGGSPMAPELLRKAIEKLGSIFMQDYGCSEAAALTLLFMEDHVLEGKPEEVRRLASCGQGIPGLDVRVLNDKGEDVQPGEIGELTVKGPTIMKGYWKLPEATAEVFKHGRFYTGDLCTMDEEGYIFIVDRKKDMIISGGLNIYPFEVESVLMEHPAVLDAAVIGTPDDEWGESVMALVVLKEGHVIKEQELSDHVKANLASYKKPKRIEFVDSLPRTMTGKLLKKDLRAKYWKGRERKV